MRYTLAESTSQTGKVELYESPDKKMVNALVALGHRPVRIEGADESLTLYYFFDQKQVIEDVNRLLTNDETLSISIVRMWAAESVWQMGLSQLRTARSNAASQSQAVPC